MKTRTPRHLSGRFFAYFGTGGRNRKTTRRRSLQLEPLEHRMLLAAGDYSIDLLGLDSSTEFSATQKAILQSAANSIEGLILADLPDVGPIDDLAITFTTSATPGTSGGTLATTKNVTSRTSMPFLPYEGTIEFDPTDLDTLESSGRLEDVAMHEIVHVMGFGTAWEALDQSAGTSLLAVDGTQYIGPAATAEYQTLLDPSAMSIPLSLGGQEGSSHGHWSESALGKELMTGWIDGVNNPISRITVASFQDMGYEVDMAQAEPFLFGTIRGTVFNDIDENRLIDTGEPGLSGWTVFLDNNADGLLDANEPSTLTDDKGEYFFSGLGANTYTIREVLENHWAQTAPTGNAYLATVIEGGTVLNQNFGNTTGTLSIDDVQQVEGDSGTTQFVFTVTLSKMVNSPVTVDFSTDITPGTATPGDQFDSISGTLTFDISDPLTQTISVSVNGDTLEESHQTFYVDLTNASNAILEDSRGEGLIFNDDGPLRVSVEGTHTLEGAEQLDFTVSLSRPDLATMTVDFSTLDGTVDFVPKTETISFEPGTTSKTVSVDLLADTLGNYDDSLVELETTLTVHLSNPSPEMILFDGAAQSTLLDDDIPKLAIGNAEAIEGEDLIFSIDVLQEGTDVNQSRGVYSSIQYETMDDSARAASGDYQPASDTLFFDPLQVHPLTILIETLPDNLDELDENIFVNLLYPDFADVSITPGSGTIVDDDLPPSISISSATPVLEGNALVWIVRLEGPSANRVSVRYTTTNDTATAGIDYSSTDGVLTFLPGELEKEIRVSTLTDNISNEGDERVGITLFEPIGGTIVSPQGEGTILDDWPTISVANSSGLENDPLTLTLTLSAPSSHLITVDYATSDGSAIAGADYAAAIGTITFVPGQIEQTVAISLVHDNVDEDDETLTVTFSNPTNGSLGTSSAEATILDDDPTPVVSIHDADPITEGSEAVFTVTLSSESTKTITFDYHTVAGTASEDDYLPAAETLTFEPGETEKTITLTTLDDLLNENDETFEVELTGGEDLVAGDLLGTATLLDDDAMPSITIADLDIIEPDVGNGSALFVVTMSVASGRPVSVDFATEDDTARVDVDYLGAVGTLTFQPGETEKSIEVLIPGDLETGPDRAFRVNLSNPTDVLIDLEQAVGTILDNDVPYTSANTPRSLPDNNTLRSTILIDESLVLIDLNLMLDITHENLSDLTARLISPDSTVIDLFAGVGVGETTMTETILDDDVETALSEGVAPYTGHFLPLESFDQLVGRNLLGLWTLEITDTTPGNTGTLNDWGLVVHTETIDPSNLGAIVILELDAVDPSGGDLWYTLGVHRDGYLTVEATAASAVDMQLIDETDSVVASGVGRIDFGQATVGSSYRLRVESTSTDVDLRLSNMIQKQGTEITVFPTEGNDRFSVNASIPRHFSINRIGYDFSAEELTHLDFDGGVGDDLVVLRGSMEDETVELSPHTALFASEDFEVSIRSVQRIHVSGGGGNDVASLYDSAEQDLYVARPNSAVMSDSAKSLYTNRVTGFGTIHGYVVNPGGFDKARLWDSPNDDTFFAEPRFGQMEGDGYSNSADSFDRVYALAVENGGFDVAELLDSEYDDLLLGSRKSVRLFSNGQFENRASGFEQVVSTSESGDVDKAFLEGSPDDDHFTGTPTEAKLVMPDSDIRVDLFEQVEIIGAGGEDSADLHDSDGDDHLIAAPKETTFTGDDFSQKLFDFGTVKAFADAGGIDLAQLYDSADDDRFIGTSTFGKLYGPEFYLRATNFEQVHAYAEAGGHDIARLTGTDGNDQMTANAQAVTLSDSNFSLEATDFDINKVFAVEGASDHDRAELFDSLGADHLLANGIGDGQAARLTYDNGQIIEAWYFDFVLAEATYGGNTKNTAPYSLEYTLNDDYWL